MKKFIGYGLVVALAASFGAIALVNTPNVTNFARADNPNYNGNSLFYARTSVDGELKYLTYSGGKTMTVTEDPEEALFDIDFQTATTATLKCGEHYLGYANNKDATTDLKEEDTVWTVEGGLLSVVGADTTPKTRYLSFRASTYNTGKAYANMDNDEYFGIYFYTPEQYNERNAICNWTSERCAALNNLKYTVPAPLEKHTISFDANGGTGTMSNVKIADGKQYSLPASTFTAPNGKRFANWKIDDTNYNVGSKITVNENITLVAQWEDIPAELPNPIVFSTLGLSNGVQYLDPFAGNGFTVTFAGGANDGKYYTTGAGIRVYGNGTMTIDSTVSMIEIIITYDGSNKPTAADVVNVGDYNVADGVWTGEATQVVFTRPSGSGHWRIKSVAVTFKA